MQRIDNPPDNLFEGGNEYTGKLGTIATAVWLTGIQEEQAKFIEATGLTLDVLDNEQIWKGMLRRFDFWRLELADVAYVDASSFTVDGDVTAVYPQHRAVKLTQTSDAKGYVASSVYSAGPGETTVTVTGCTVDSGLSAVEYGQEIENKPYNPNVIFVGAELMVTAATPPTGWHEQDGAGYSMTTYESLYDFLGTIHGKNTGVNFTADQATDTLTSAGHGLIDDDVVELSNSGGALPAGLSADTKYFIVSAATNTYQVSASKGGTPINFTDNGTGTHSFHTQLKVCDMRGEFARGWDHSAGNDPDAASRTDRGDGTGGDVVGSKQLDEFKEHDHADTPATATFDSAGATTALKDATQHGGSETRGRNVNKMYIIKY